MSKLHIGPHTHGQEGEPATETFDREINLKAIGWTVGILVAVTLVVHVIIYGLIVGFNKFDDKREPRISPIAEVNPQTEPPLPRLQDSPEMDLKKFRDDEDQLIGQAQWVDQSQGRLRIPIDLAMEIVAGRGLGPEVVGGTPGATPDAMVPQVPGQPGALVQMSRQPSQQPQAEATPPPPQERR